KMTELFDNLSCHHSIDDFRNRVYSTLYSMISIMGFVGNGVVLYVLIRTYRQKTAFQVYMLNLAVSDFLCVCTLPLRVVYYVHKGNWFFSDFLCREASGMVSMYCLRGTGIPAAPGCVSSILACAGQLVVPSSKAEESHKPLSIPEGLAGQSWC
ncbi:Cysteinyl leukotriene receptor 1, partial [Anas platyrhynchos]